MSPGEPSSRLRKALGPFSVFAIATGSTLSSGLFLLPGISAANVGPAVIASYLIAAVPLVPAVLSVIEMATATPKSGGPYYFLDRAMGPGVGTIAGVGTWLGFVLKTAFALVGMGAYVSLFFERAPVTWMAVGLAVVFGAVNLVGAKATATAQIVMVAGGLGTIGWLLLAGLPAVEAERFGGFWNAPLESIFETAAMAYVSYIGLMKVASVAEEVRDPERNLPLGVLASVVTALVVYTGGIVVMVGVVPATELHRTLTPMASAARVLGGRVGEIVMVIAALLCFASVANAGILGASRYPMAMARDGLLPPALARVGKDGIPRASVLLTLALVVTCIVLFDPKGLAKLASAFLLLMFAMVCGAVIVMRESGIASYDPGFRSPLYPYTQIVGIFSAVFLIARMGWLPQVFTVLLAGGSLIWFFKYAKPRVSRPGAVLRVFDRLGRASVPELDVELRGILKEKGMRQHDPFDEMVTSAPFLELEPGCTFELATTQAARVLAEWIPESPEWIHDAILDGTRGGATPVSHGIALPHCRHAALARPRLVVARSRTGIVVDPADEDWGGVAPKSAIRALFFLASPDADPGQHLRLLAALARRAEHAAFLGAFLAAEGEEGVVRALLADPGD